MPLRILGFLPSHAVSFSQFQDFLLRNCVEPLRPLAVRPEIATGSPYQPTQQWPWSAPNGTEASAFLDVFLPSEGRLTRLFPVRTHHYLTGPPRLAYVWLPALFAPSGQVTPYLHRPLPTLLHLWLPADSDARESAPPPFCGVTPSGPAPRVAFASGPL